jgi:hypothetical protein
MQKVFITIVLLFTSKTCLFAQTPVEVFAGHKQARHEFFFFKNLDSTNRFNLFSIASFAIDYKDKNFNSSYINSQVTYNLTKNWGISTGAFYADKEFSPLVAISYFYINKKGDFYITLFPTMRIKESPIFELFGITSYSPKLTDNFNFFSQIIFGSSFNNRLSQHLVSTQQIRVGLGYKNLFQFGAGIDNTFLLNGKGDNYSNNIGLFIRKEL